MAGWMLWWVVMTVVRPAATVSELAWREPLRRVGMGASVVALTDASVLTVDDPREMPPRPASSAAPGDVQAVETADQAAWWRARMDAARARVEQARQQVEAWDARLSTLAREAAGLDDPAHRGAVLRERSAALLERETTAALLAQAQAAVATVEEAARRAGIPPGWIR